MIYTGRLHGIETEADAKSYFEEMVKQERVKRIVGNKLQAIRRRYFAKHPLCQCKDARCQHNNKNIDWDEYPGVGQQSSQHVVAATILDHIKPLHQGGTNDESNYQGLCEMCHDWKTTTERGNTSKPYAAQGLDWV